MGSAYVDKLEHAQQDLVSYFDTSAAVVRNNFVWFEKQFAKPAIAYFITSFNTHPFITTFLAIFTFFSLLPVVSFLGISIFVIVSVTFLTFALSCILIAIVEVVLVTVLAVAMVCLLMVALISTPLALSSYLTLKFINHVRKDGRAGACLWAVETRQHLIRRSTEINENEIIEGSEVSTGSGSVVVVDIKKDVKVQGD